MKKEKTGNGAMKNFFGKVKAFFVMLASPFKKLYGKMKVFYKNRLEYPVDKYKAFTALQVKEVFSREKATTNVARERVISIVSPIIKFVIVFAITFVLFFLNSIFGIIQQLSLYNFFVFFYCAINFLIMMVSLWSLLRK